MNPRIYMGDDGNETDNDFDGEDPIDVSKLQELI
jgi:hypothetical protein